jgi:hypothetical protein
MLAASTMHLAAAARRRHDDTLERARRPRYELGETDQQHRITQIAQPELRDVPRQLTAASPVQALGFTAQLTRLSFLFAGQTGRERIAFRIANPLHKPIQPLRAGSVQQHLFKDG